MKCLHVYSTFFPRVEMSCFFSSPRDFPAAYCYPPYPALFAWQGRFLHAQQTQNIHIEDIHCSKRGHFSCIVDNVMQNAWNRLNIVMKYFAFNEVDLSQIESIWQHHAKLIVKESLSTSFPHSVFPSLVFLFCLSLCVCESLDVASILHLSDYCTWCLIN